MGMDANRYTIQSVDKALDLLELLADEGSMSLIELTERLNQPKSSTYRILLTLENRGFIARSDEDGKYCLGYKQLMLTRKLLERNNLRAAALQEMKRLSELFGDTINLGVLVEGSVLYVEIIESNHALRMTDTVGSKAPVHATAIGKAIAAHLPQGELEELLDGCDYEALTERTIRSREPFLDELAKVRKAGYAFDNQEVVEGACCVAAPVFNMFGQVAGAISVSGPVHRYLPDKAPEIAVQVVACAQAVSRKLGYARGE
jgi:IclR family acetate operon transcriptional repressor